MKHFISNLNEIILNLSGDTRAPEQPALAAMHTLFMREHNRMTAELKKHNPHWNDEQLFQQSRRIVSAINQHITYNEWLPRVLGWNAINLYDLNLIPEGYYDGLFIYMHLLASKHIFNILSYLLKLFLFFFYYFIEFRLL